MADILRWVLVIGSAGTLYLLGVVVTVYHRRSVVDPTAPPMRALVLLAGSYAILMLVLAGDSIDRMGTPVTWHLPPRMAALVLSNVGLGMLANFAAGRTDR